MRHRDEVVEVEAEVEAAAEVAAGLRMPSAAADISEGEAAECAWVVAAAAGRVSAERPGSVVGGPCRRRTSLRRQAGNIAVCGTT